ncbi:MAG: hypothetical protein ABW166_14745, partial [Sedimenticola sp.]
MNSRIHLLTLLLVTVVLVMGVLVFRCFSDGCPGIPRPGIPTACSIIASLSVLMGPPCVCQIPIPHRIRHP